MPILRLTLITFSLLFFSYTSFSNDRYWIGTGGGNWNDPANWALNSGDPTDNQLPNTGDDVYFDLNSGVGTILVTSNVDISKLFFTNDCDALTLEISYGTFNIINTLYMDGISQTLNITGGNLITNGNVFINGGFVNLTLGSINSASNINTSGTPIVNFSNGNISITGSLNLAGGNTFLNGAILGINTILSIAANANFTTNSGTINLNGTGEVLSITGGIMTVAGATINVGNGVDESVFVSSGNLTLSSGIINVKNYYRVNSGNSTISGGILNVGIGTNVNTPAFKLPNSGILSGGIINILNVESSGLGTAIDIGSLATCSGGLIKISASLANYKIMAKKCYNLEIDSPNRVSSLSVNCLIYGNLTITNGSFNYITPTLPSTPPTITFTGSTSQNIVGNNPTLIEFYNLRLNNTNGLTIAPTSNISVYINNLLTLSSGKITLGNYNLCIGNAGINGSITGSSSNNYIITNGTGVLKQYNIGTGQRTSVLFPIGINSGSYTPVIIEVSGSSTVDNFSVRVSDNMLKLGTSGFVFTSNKVDKTWHISEETPTGSSVTITPFWNLSNELTSFSRALCEVKHFNTVWVSENGSAWSGPTNGLYSVTSDPVTSFSPFGVGSPLLLPIELIDFSATIENRNVILSWKTETELNNDHFEILRSFDGFNFEKIKEIKGAGNSIQAIKYSCIDKNTPIGIIYYKLHQNDFNGESTNSDIITVNMNSNKEYNLIFPNPLLGEIININLEKDFQNIELVISIIDDKGNLVFNYIENPITPILTINLNKKLQNGIYNINIKSKDKEINQKITIL